MKLVFLGTRGNIRAHSAEHRKHSVLAVCYRDRRVIIDCGADWLGEALDWEADALLITHTHCDHVDGLKQGAPCPVYATADSWQRIARFPIHERHTVYPGKEYRIAEMRIVPFSVEHSTRAPAVGYRISAGGASIFYCPDLALIHRCRAALRGVSAYIGDGATIVRSMVRRRGGRLIGHAPLAVQLRWCQQAGVRRAIVTHCGTQIVTAPPEVLRDRMAALSREYGLRIDVARDGIQVLIRHSGATRREL